MPAVDSGLRDKTVLVTGASGGIGSATARAFAAEGARLVLHARTRPEAAQRLAAELQAETLVVAADLRDETEVGRMFEAAVGRFRTIDVLVANAGIWPPEDVPLARLSLERWNDTLASDLTSVFLCARGFLAHLEARRAENAAIVMIGSTAAVFGEAGHADYAAAKAALTYGLTRTLKNEIVRIVPAGRVNTVCPGWTLTDMARPGLDDPGVIVRVLQTRALRRVGRPEDIASAVVFLASDRLAGHVTGQILTVAGGMEGRLLHRPGEIDPASA